MDPIGIIGTEWIRVEPEAGGFAGKLKGMLGGGGPIGAKFGLEVAVGVGVGLFTIGEKFHTLYNTVAVRTGATGKVLEGLKGSVNNVLSGTAGSFEQVGKAISLLYTRTGLTGGALEKLAKQQVTLARITKTDVGENVDATTKLFAKYGIAAKDQGRELDVLFKASQQAGVGIGDIIQPMLKGGAALQQFGFGVDKSAALIASLTKAGVNVQPALMSLRTAFAKIAKEGGDPVKVLHNLEQALTDGKNPALAMKEAMGLLGARGGLELANAIKTGKFSLDGMLKTITDGKGGIAATGVAVSTVGGKFQMLKNQALVAIQPIASAVYDFANNALGNLVAWIDRSGGLAGVFEKWKLPILAAAGALLLLISPFTALAVGLAILYARSETFRNVISAIGDMIRTNFVPAMLAVGQVGQVIIAKFQELADAVRSRWADIQASIQHVLQAIELVIAVVVGTIMFIWQHFHNQIMLVVTTAWNLIKGLVQSAMQQVLGVIDIVLGLLSGHWARAWKGVQEVLGGIWDGIIALVKGALGLLVGIVSASMAAFGLVVANGVKAVVGFFAGIGAKIIGAFKSAGTWLYDAGKQIMLGLVNGIAQSGVNVGQAILDHLPGPVKGIVGGILGIGGGSKDFSTFINGLGSGSTPQRRTGQAHAGGGSVMAGIGYPVGERGPEWFTPGVNGTIIPNRGAGGGTTIVLAPVFPPGMDAATALAHMQAFTVETIAKTFEDVAANGRVGTGTNR